MNSISILFLLSDWLPTIGKIAGVSALLMIGFAILVMFMKSDAYAEGEKEGKTDEEMERELEEHGYPKVLKWWPAFALAVAIYTVCPSQRTIYFIMASEVSEDALKSETSRRVFDAVNHKLEEYLGTADKVRDRVEKAVEDTEDE